MGDTSGKSIHHSSVWDSYLQLALFSRHHDDWTSILGKPLYTRWHGSKRIYWSACSDVLQEDRYVKPIPSLFEERIVCWAWVWEAFWRHLGEVIYH